MKTRPNKVLPGVHPNAGLTVQYKKQLDKLIDDMNRSVTYWLRAAYRKQESRIATDATPVRNLQDVMKRLKKHWLKVFDTAAPILAQRFAEKVHRSVDLTIETQFDKLDMGIDFKLTAEAKNVLDATVGENVALIRSIPQQYLTEVEGLVMRAVTVGGDLKTLSEELHHRYGVTKRRAAFISRDQNAKATANMVRVRQQNLGITHAKWLHSHGGKDPRASHLEYDGKTFEIAKGAYIDGEWIYPGEKPNCRCISRPIIPG